MTAPTYKLRVSHIGLHRQSNEYPSVTIRPLENGNVGFVAAGIVMDEMSEARMYWTEDRKYAAFVGIGTDGRRKLWEFEFSAAKGSE